jgi:hypothetical protein
MRKETLDKLEDLFISQLLDAEGTMPAAKLDILRKALEKNNRLYCRPEVKDCGPALDEIADLDWSPEDDGKVVLPFPRKKAKA